MLVDSTESKGANEFFVLFFCGFQYYLDGEKGRHVILRMVGEVEISRYWFGNVLTDASFFFVIFFRQSE